MLWNSSFFSSFVSCELNNIIEFKFVLDVLTDPEVLCGGRRLGWEKLGCGFYTYGDLTVELVMLSWWCWVGEFTVACSFWVNLNGLPNGGMRYESNQKLELCIFFCHFLCEPSLSLSSSFSWFSPKSFAYYLTFFC